MSIKKHIFCRNVLASGELLHTPLWELALAPGPQTNHLAQLNNYTYVCV